MKNVELKKIPRPGSIETLFVVVKDGVEVGVVTKMKSNRSFLCPWKSFLGIGQGQTFVGHFFDEAEYKKFGYDRMPVANPTGAPEMVFGGKQAAVAAILSKVSS